MSVYPQKYNEKEAALKVGCWIKEGALCAQGSHDHCAIHRSANALVRLMSDDE